MPNWDAKEVGRHLEVTFGEGADDAITYQVKPVNTRIGRALLGQMLIALQSTEPEAALNEEMYETAVGKDLYATALDELRSPEFTWLAQVAFYWQVHGGGMRLVRMMVEDHDGPKALTALIQGIDPERLAAALTAVSQTSTSTESESPTPEETTPDTTSPSTSSDSSESGSGELSETPRSTSESDGNAPDSSSSTSD